MEHDETILINEVLYGFLEEQTTREIDSGLESDQDPNLLQRLRQTLLQKVAVGKRTG